jgi:kynurenine formamidase
VIPARIARGAKLVGIDNLFIGDSAAHHNLLRAGGRAVEGSACARSKTSSYALPCLPLRLVGSDGTPARTVLTSRNGEATMGECFDAVFGGAPAARPG